MARGIQPSAEQLREEDKCEAVAVAMDLIRHDQWELAHLDVIGALMANGQVFEARALLVEFRRHDLVENGKHRAILTALREMAV